MMTDPHCYDLDSLPPELLLPILSHLPDLESLDSLLRASPAASRVFDTQGATVFQAVLSSGSTHTYTCALIRIIALLRADALPPTVHDLVSFKDLVRHETTEHRWGPPRWVYPPTSWPSDMPTAVVRGLLVTNRRVQRLAFGCLEYYLDRFRSLSPSNSAEFSAGKDLVEFSLGHGKFGKFTEEHLEFMGPWQEKLPNTPYQYPVHDVGPPSWVEQQRALRAFWRTQLSRDLNAAVDASRIVWANEEESYWMDRMSPAALCDVPHVFLDREGVNRWLGHRELILRETLLEHELIESAIRYTQEVKEAINNSTYWRLKKDSADSSMPINQEDWKTLDLTFTSDMWNFFDHVAGNPWQHERSFSALQHVKFETFRRFGFAIWSSTRMVGYGLLVDGHCYTINVYLPYFEAWRNLLTQDERDAVDRENKNLDANGSLATLPDPFFYSYQSSFRFFPS